MTGTVIMEKGETMRLIDADALIDELGISDEDIIFEGMLEDAPTIDAAPVRHGHWIEYGENEDGTHNICCSICDGFIKSKGHANSCYTRNKYRYCPNCGARMDGEK